MCCQDALFGVWEDDVCILEVKSVGLYEFAIVQI